MVEFLGTLPINLRMNKWRSEEDKENGIGRSHPRNEMGNGTSSSLYMIRMGRNSKKHIKLDPPIGS